MPPGHLDQEPVIKRDKPSQDQKELMAARADLFLAYANAGLRLMRSHVSRSLTRSRN
jgi:hypothetical protein